MLGNAGRARLATVRARSTIVGNEAEQVDAENDYMKIDDHVELDRSDPRVTFGRREALALGNLSILAIANGVLMPRGAPIASLMHATSWSPSAPARLAGRSPGGAIPKRFATWRASTTFSGSSIHRISVASPRRRGKCRSRRCRLALPHASIGHPWRARLHGAGLRWASGLQGAGR